MNAVVLASGGLDSTVTAAVAKQEGWELCLLTIVYGQRHQIEVTRAKEVAVWVKAKEHKVLPLDLSGFGGSALVGDGSVPKNPVRGPTKSRHPKHLRGQREIRCFYRWLWPTRKS